MTFAEYNTDDNFDKKESSLDELVKIGVSEGKSSDKIRNALSPKWQKSKYIGEFDNYFNKYSTPKETVTEKENVAETPKVEDVETTLTGREKAYNDKQNKLAETAKKEMMSDIKKDSERNWQSLYDASIKRANAYKAIDDHYLEGLPNFIFRRYQNGEFGKIDDTSTPEGKESKKNAQLRLASFIINGIGTALSNTSNIIKGRPLEESDAEKFRSNQMANALQNRWEKNKADTEGAIKAVEKEYGNEQDARIAAEQFTRDQKANTKWNMMSQNQKIFALQVTKEIGDMLGGMNTSELANFIAGSALTGDMSKEELIAIGIAKLAANSPDLIKNLPDGNIKTMVMSMIGGEPTEVIAGIGGGEVPKSDVYDSKETGNKIKNPLGNLKGYKSLDGNTYNFDTFATKEEKDNLAKISQDLSKKYYDGEIDAATYRKYLDPLVNEAKKHTGIKLYDADKMIKDNINLKLKDLNKATKNGSVTVDSYKEQTAKILAMAEDAGYSTEEISKLKKDFMNTDKIHYKGPNAK